MADKKIAAEDKKADEELVIVETDEHGKPLVAADDASNTSGAESEQTQDESAADDGEEERVGHSEGDDEVDGETIDERRARRKRQRQARNARRRQMGESKDRQISELLSANQVMLERIAAIEGRSVQYDVNNLQDKLATINSQITQAKDTLAACVKAGDGAGVAEVTDIQYSLRDQKRQIEMLLQRSQQQRQRSANTQSETTQSREQQLPPVAVANAIVWASKHSWYDQKGHDQDSKAVQEIDADVLSEGFDPQTPEYWEELDDRIRERLPHRFSSKNGSAQRQASGPKMSSSSGTATANGRRLGKNEVYVSPERKAAMQAAGAWDDPKKRARLLSRYAEADRESASARH